MLLEHYYNPFEWEDIPEYCEYFAREFGVELRIYGNEKTGKEKTLWIHGKEKADNFMIKKIKSFGLPSPWIRWCSERYKQQASTHVARQYNKKGIKYIQALGIRAEESRKRAKMPDRGVSNGAQPYCYPIFKLSDDEVCHLAITNNIKLHHAYKFFRRMGCPSCPMTPAEDFLILRKKYPKVWYGILRLYLLSLECDYYRKSDRNRPKADFGRFMGVSASKKLRGDKWVPPERLTFWRSKN